jgi:ornithine cyclodeaminase
MMLYDANNGDLLALIDCDWITTMRTGAVAAVSAKALRKSGASKYGFIGLGNTARATMLCVLEAEPEKRFDVKLLRYKDQAESFAERFMGYANVRFEIVDDVKELVSDIDVLISCITSADGLLVEDEKLLKPGITVIPVHMRGFQNCDTTFDRVFGDDTDHVKGFKYFNQFNDYNEIGEVLSGNDPGRKSDEQRIIDYNYGLALHDVVYASKIFELVKDSDIPEVEIQKETAKFWV